LPFVGELTRVNFMGKKRFSDDYDLTSFGLSPVGSPYQYNSKLELLFIIPAMEKAYLPESGYNNQKDSIAIPFDVSARLFVV